MTDRIAKFKGVFGGVGGAMASWPARMLFPPVCLGCREQVADPGSLCGRCWPKLRFLERPWCEVLGTPFSVEIGEGIVSADAIANPPPFRRARSAVVYAGIARDMVHDLKFRDRAELAPWMARWMLRAGSELIEDADVVVPIPLHRRRFLWRRFNQSAELARTLAKLSGKPFEPGALRRVRATRQQVGLGMRAREDNVRGAFKVPPDADILVRGRRVLVVDDVYTTGTTVAAATRALKRSGASAVDVLTFARVLPGDFQQHDAGTI